MSAEPKYNCRTSGQSHLLATTHHPKMSLSNFADSEVSTSHGSSYSVSFPNQRNIFTSGSVVSGIVHVSPEKCRLNKIVEITVKLRGVQVSSNSQGPQYLVTKLLKMSSSIWSPNSLNHSVSAQDTIPVPFKFEIPSTAEQASLGKFLPPSFRGGTWPLGFEKIPGDAMNRGTAVAKITYSIKVTGIKPKLLKRNERFTLPFVYMPPSVAFRSDIPLPLELPPIKLWMDSTDPLSVPPDRWKTFEVEENLRQNMFSKKGKLLIQFSIPSVAGFPAYTPIPYHFLIKTYTRCKSGETSAPEPLFASSLSNLQMTMYRRIWTQVGSMREVVNQTAARLVDHVEPSSVACCEPTQIKLDCVDWWVHQAVHVGQFTLDVGPGFEAGPWNLACSYYIKMHLPVKGLLNTVDSMIAPKIAISSTEVREYVDGSDLMNPTSDEGNQLFPPDYWDVVDGDNALETSEKKSW